MSLDKGKPFSFDGQTSGPGLFDRILVPLDGSSSAESVLYQAQEILCRRKCEVLLFHSIRPRGTDPGGPSPLPNPEAYLRGVEEMLSSQGARVRVLVRAGPVEETILAAIRSEGASLIALSSHGAGTAPEVPIANTIEKVLRGCPVPLLVTRALQSWAPGEIGPARCEPSNIRRILVPLDGSSACEAVMPYARDLAQMLQALIVVLHVDPELPYAPGSFSGSRMIGRPGGAPPGDGSSNEDRVAYAAKTFSAVGLDVMTLNLGGDPISTILEFAHPSAVDLIAMTTHGRTGLSKLLLGSVAQKVLRETLLPTLLIKGATGDAAQCLLGE